MCRRLLALLGFRLARDWFLGDCTELLLEIPRTQRSHHFETLPGFCSWPTCQVWTFVADAVAEELFCVV